MQGIYISVMYTVRTEYTNLKWMYSNKRPKLYRPTNKQSLCIGMVSFNGRKEM